MDVKAAFVRSLRDDPQRSLIRFDTWPKRYAFEVMSRGGRTLIKPDGFIRIGEERDGERAEYDFFLEVDMGTETLDRVVEKCVHYREHYRNGGHASFCGGVREEARVYPFRVLVTCQSDERCENLAMKLTLLNPPILSMVLFSTQATCANGVLGEIWMTPSKTMIGILT